jgi:branched-chain amino acid transport system substrate-binding protein
MRKPAWKLAVAGLALVLALCIVTGCGGSSNQAASTGTSQKPCLVHIALVTSVTGDGSSWGQPNEQGAEAAVKHVNSTGGVLGCQLDLDVIDNGSNFSEALSLLQRAASSTHFAMVSTPDTSAPTMAPWLNANKILEIGGAADPDIAEPSVPYPDNFETFIPASATMIAGLKYGLSEGYKRFALLVNDQADGESIPPALAPYVKAAGATITDTEHLDFSGVDFTPAIERAQASKPQALLVNLFGPALGHLITEIHDAGWQIPIIGGDDNGGTNLDGLVPSSYLTDNVVIAPAAEASPASAATQAFINDLDAAGVTISQPIPSYACEYDAVILFAWAAEQTHSLNAGTLAAKLHSTGTTPVPGLVDSSTTGYTPTSGEWAGQLAIMKEAYLSQGQLPLVKVVSG